MDNDILQHTLLSELEVVLLIHIETSFTGEDNLVVPKELVPGTTESLLNNGRALQSVVEIENVIWPMSTQAIVILVLH